MGYSSCPKCGYPEPFDDECPKCGVYVSKYIAVQERLSSAGPWQGAAAPQALRPKTVPPPGAFPAGPRPPTETSHAGTILWWAVGLLLLAGVGCLVLVDWFGAGVHFDAPPGWREVDDDVTEQAVQGMCPRARDKTTVHAFYTLDGAGAQTAMGIIEIDELLPMDDSTLAQLRGGFEQAQGRMQGVELARAERVFYGGRPAVEVQVDLAMGGLSNSMLQLMMAAERSTMVFVLIAPSDVFRRQLDAVRKSLATLHPLPAGLRGKPWFKYSLRWLWVLAVVGTAAFGLSRLRRGGP